MTRTWAEYDGRTIYSAAHLAGLGLHPVKDYGEASIADRELTWNPFLDVGVQRTQFIQQIALHLALRGNAGSVDDNVLGLDAALLPA